MLLDFLTPPIDVINGSGNVETAHSDELIGRFRRPFLMIPRSYCTFALFNAASLPKGKRRQAATIYARATAPYLSSGFTLVDNGASYGVWWWDAERLAPLIDAHYGSSTPITAPETLSQPDGDSWRIVKLSNGYEGQFWKDGALQASTWRLTSFDAPSWAAFARLQRGVESPPDTPPPAQYFPVATSSKIFSLAKAEIDPRKAAIALAALVVLAVGSTSMFFLGQGSKFSADTADIAAEVQTLEKTSPAPVAVRAMEKDRQVLAAYRKTDQATNPLTAIGAALGIAEMHELTPSAVDAAGDTIAITLPYDAVKQADALIEDYAGSGYFYDVQPRTDAPNKTFIVTMKVREAVEPLSVGA